MLNSFFTKTKTFLISLRLSILSIFVSMFVFAMLLLIAINYFHSSKLLLFTADKLMHEVSSSINHEFSREIEAAVKDNALSAQFLEHRIVDVNNFPEIMTYTYDIAYRFYLVQAAHWADEKGNSIIAQYDPDDSISTIIYNRGLTPNLKIFIDRDINGRVLKQINSRTLDYDARERPWYIAAKAAGKTIWTDIYVFAPTPYLGLTIATPVFKKTGDLLGVFGLDIRLDWLSWYIGEQKISENSIIFIVTTDGKIIAFPGFDKREDQTKMVDIHSLSTPWIGKSFDIYKKTLQQEFSFTFQNETYLAVYLPIPHFAVNGWIIGVVVPKDDFIGELKKSTLINLAISLTILILGIAFVSSLVTKVVKPIKKLVTETEKIKNFELEEREQTQSRIKEIMILSNAVQAMKTGLKSFQSYVPASLVRQLIETGENARIGGSKRELAVLFSDIKDFTQISENMDPDSLMEYMCEYFEALSKIIMSEGGTIDKYIGDSVMTFWGAPLSVTNASHHAAHAALRCLHRLNDLNVRWEQNGKSRLETRFGIHLGDAVVGNVGSSERLNYTALGDTINTASRLEGVNKIYGTQILVSEKVFEKIKNDFVLRLVDCIAVKGKKKSECIYELLNEHKNQLAFDVDQYNKFFAAGFSAYQNQQWKEAIEFFRQCTVIYPGDSIAPIFILRCQTLQLNPPKNWDGVWRMSEK